MREFKTPPHDTNAEAGVICTLIRHPEFELKSEHLQPSFFYYPENGEIYRAIKRLVNQGVTNIDELTLTTQLSMISDTDKLFYGETKEKIRELIDGASYVARSSEEEYKVLVDTVIGLGFKRHAVAKLQDIIGDCMECKIDNIDEVNSKLLDTVNNLATDFITGDEIDYFGKKMDTIWEKIKNRRNADGTYGILPRWSCLKDYFTYQNGELTLYCARKKKGKSVIALNETLDKAKSGLNVVYFDTEMKDELFMTRLCSHATGISEDKIKNGTMSYEEEKIFDDTYEWLKTLPIIHEYSPNWTKEGIITQAKILHNKGKCDFFIFDYLKENSKKEMSASDRSRELGKWADAIKNGICGALDIPGIAFAQLGRDMNIANSDEISRYVTTGITWDTKTNEEICKHGKECGNMKMKVDFNRIGKSHDEDDEDDYLDFNFIGEILTIQETKAQHTRDDATPFEEE